MGEGGEFAVCGFRSGWKQPSLSGLSSSGADGEISFSELISLQSDGWLLVMKTKWRIRLISGMLKTALNSLLTAGPVFFLTSS